MTIMSASFVRPDWHNDRSTVEALPVPRRPAEERQAAAPIPVPRDRATISANPVRRDGETISSRPVPRERATTPAAPAASPDARPGASLVPGLR